MRKPNEGMRAIKAETGMHLVNFIYTDRDGAMSQLFALCEAIPRVGELIEPESGKTGYVHQIVHKATSGEFGGQTVSFLTPNVLLGSEPPA